MLKELVQDKVNFVGGGRRGCNCCCKRNPYISYYEGIWVGHVDSESICLSLCNTRKDSLGYMFCIDDKRCDIECSTLNNTELADEIDRYRTKRPRGFGGIDTKKMRELDVH